MTRANSFTNYMSSSITAAGLIDKFNSTFLLNWSRPASSVLSAVKLQPLGQQVPSSPASGALVPACMFTFLTVNVNSL